MSSVWYFSVSRSKIICGNDLRKQKSEDYEYESVGLLVSSVAFTHELIEIDTEEPTVGDK